jgi:hypothetical protein
VDLMSSDCVRSPQIAPLLIRYYPIAPLLIRYYPIAPLLIRHYPIAPLLIRYYPIAPLLIRYYPLSNGGALVLPFARTATPRGRLISPGLAADEDRALLSTPARTEPSRDAHDDARALLSTPARTEPSRDAHDDARALLSTPARTEPSRDAHDDARDESSGASGGLRGETRGGTGKSLEGREAISARDDALLAAEVLGARISRSRACEDASSY